MAEDAAGRKWPDASGSGLGYGEMWLPDGRLGSLTRRRAQPAEGLCLMAEVLQHRTGLGQQWSLSQCIRALHQEPPPRQSCGVMHAECCA